MGPGYGPTVRPADSPRAESYPDDPEIVNNLYQVGLFLGAPQFRSSGPNYFPASASVRPSVVFGAPASSSSAVCFFPPGGDWRQIIGHLAEGPGVGVSGDNRGGDDGSPHARPGGASSQDYPVSPQAAYREGPREGARYAYRGTIVGEASRPGPVDPGAVPQSQPPTVGHRWSLIDPGEGYPCFSGGGGLLMACPMGESRRPCREPSSASGGGDLACLREGGPRSVDGGAAPEASPMGESGCGYLFVPFGLHRAGPREGARYGHRGTIVGEASHPGLVPPADLLGAAAPGEVLRYMRPTAGAGPVLSRGGGHRQRKGGRASGSGRRGRSSLGARGTPPARPGGVSPRLEGATPHDPGANSPLVYTRFCVRHQPSRFRRGYRWG